MESGKPPSHIWEIRVEGEEVEVNEQFYLALQHMRRREAGDSVQLDMSATIDATVKNAGLADFRYRQLTRPPEYCCSSTAPRLPTTGRGSTTGSTRLSAPTRCLWSAFSTTATCAASGTKATPPGWRETVKELRCPACVRYVDDFVLFGGDKESLWHKKKAIEVYLSGARC